MPKIKLPYHSPHKIGHGHAFFIKKRSKNFNYLEAQKVNLIHSNVQTTDSLYGLDGKRDIKEQIHNLSNSVDINLLEEIPPEDRQFVLKFYRLYKNNNTNLSEIIIYSLYSKIGLCLLKSNIDTQIQNSFSIS